jgi:hypothetical protein
MTGAGVEVITGRGGRSEEMTDTGTNGAITTPGDGLSKPELMTI